jgi:hydrogenase expression/formation protein HypC
MALELRSTSIMCLAVPGKIVEAADVGSSRIAKVQFGGVSRQVYLDFVPEAQPGDYVLVHVGFAISRVEPEEALRTYELLKQMGELVEDELVEDESVEGPLAEEEGQP